MKKVIELDPIIIESCKQCLFSTLVWKGFWNTKGRYFCTNLVMSKKYAKEMGQEFVCENTRNKEESYLLLKYPDKIHEMCPLKDYKVK